MNDGPQINRTLGVVENGASRAEDPYPRFVARNGQPSIRRVGLQRQRFGDGYHWLMTLSWARFLLLWMGVYLGVIAFFAVLFWLQPGGVAQARPGVLVDNFFFSVQTLGTIGYGDMWPKTVYANVLVTVEAFASLALTAVGTGLIFSRVSRPTARVMFSRCAVVTPRNGQLNLMFRAGNIRNNQILEADVSVTLARRGFSREGVEYRGFVDLKTVRAHSPLFGLTWTIMHVIDEESPLHGATRESLEETIAEIVIVLSGVDDTFAQRIHARHSYLPHEIVWGRRLADIILKDENGVRYVDYGRFHDLIEDVVVDAPA
ncbi:ion channel [Caulobacter sp. S45]|uniref:ion channel n=1 Tax=Caulobacter sp. S45 TaxID=1641861 RepID=UPI001C2D7470|nr:ion channel [Caulobacter sp. S45]